MATTTTDRAAVTFPALSDHDKQLLLSQRQQSWERFTTRLLKIWKQAGGNKYGLQFHHVEALHFCEGESYPRVRADLGGYSVDAGRDDGDPLGDILTMANDTAKACNKFLDLVGPDLRAEPGIYHFDGGLPVEMQPEAPEGGPTPEQVRRVKAIKKLVAKLPVCLELELGIEHTEFDTLDAGEPITVTIACDAEADADLSDPAFVTTWTTQLREQATLINKLADQLDAAAKDHPTLGPVVEAPPVLTPITRFEVRSGDRGELISTEDTREDAEQCVAMFDRCKRPTSPAAVVVEVQVSEPVELFIIKQGDKLLHRTFSRVQAEGFLQSFNGGVTPTNGLAVLERSIVQLPITGEPQTVEPEAADDDDDDCDDELDAKKAALEQVWDSVTDFIEVTYDMAGDPTCGVSVSDNDIARGGLGGDIAGHFVREFRRVGDVHYRLADEVEQLAKQHEALAPVVKPKTRPRFKLPTAKQGKAGTNGKASSKGHAKAKAR